MWIPSMRAFTQGLWYLIETSGSLRYDITESRYIWFLNESGPSWFWVIYHSDTSKGNQNHSEIDILTHWEWCSQSIYWLKGWFSIDSRGLRYWLTQNPRWLNMRYLNRLLWDQWCTSIEMDRWLNMVSTESIDSDHHSIGVAYLLHDMVSISDSNPYRFSIHSILPDTLWLHQDDHSIYESSLTQCDINLTHWMR